MRLPSPLTDSYVLQVPPDLTTCTIPPCIQATNRLDTPESRRGCKCAAFQPVGYANELLVPRPSALDGPNAASIQAIGLSTAALP
jgi:hypothetical protein